MLLLSPPTPKDVIELITEAAQIMVASFHAFAGEVNFKKGKTEALIMVRGEGADAVNLRIWKDLAGIIPLSIGGRHFALHTIMSYKHLGIAIDAKFSRAEEHRRRVASTTKPLSILNKMVFPVAALPIHGKWSLSE